MHVWMNGWTTKSLWIIGVCAGWSWTSMSQSSTCMLTSAFLGSRPGTTWSCAKPSSTPWAIPIKYGSLGGATKSVSSGSILTDIQPEKSALPSLVSWASKMVSGIAHFFQSIQKQNQVTPVTVGHGLVTLASLSLCIRAFLLVTAGHGLVTAQSGLKRACAVTFLHVIACQTCCDMTCPQIWRWRSFRVDALYIGVTRADALSWNDDVSYMVWHDHALKWYSQLPTCDQHIPACVKEHTHDCTSHAIRHSKVF